tara:strand:+ start:386 stop:856 length:471 start_codon:yes stop_codon:yes gene_type:complete
MIKIFATDVDGVLTDSGMYYTDSGDEIKRFSTYDGMAFELLRKRGIKIAIITSENTQIVSNRAKKLSVDYLYQGINNKLEVIEEICHIENVSFNQVAYIGDDINDLEVLNKVLFKACPSNSMHEVKNVTDIIHLKKAGGDGAVREFVEILIKKGIC